MLNHEVPGTGMQEGNWKKKVAARQKEYKNFLKRADKNKVLKKFENIKCALLL